MKKISILLVILWMGIIFYFSNQPANVSTSQSNKVINTINTIMEDNKLLHTLYKLKGESFIIRKSAHIVSYTILSILSFIMVYSHKNSILLSIKYSFIISTLYAITDEIHQVFIPGRAGMIQDVIIDSIGIIIGLILISIIYKLLINKINIKNKV